MPIKLPNITMCAVDCLSPEIAALALQKSQKECEFDRTILLTDKEIKSTGDYDIVKIDTISSINEYSHFILKQLNDYIKTDFVLLIQWDGFIVDAKIWNANFLNFDFIGARWHHFQDHRNIGNGGFSLRSKKLLETTSLESFGFIENQPEDVQIGRIYRDALIADHVIKFADSETADAFSYEAIMPNFPTFGFHGLMNLWRHYNDSEMIAILERLNLQSINKDVFVILMINYFQIQKYKILRMMYVKLKFFLTQESLMNSVLRVTNNREFSNHFLRICEKL